MVTYYAVVVTDNAGVVQTYGNNLGELAIVSIDINKQNRIGIVNITLDNITGLLHQDFTNLNAIEIFVLPEGIVADPSDINNYYKRFGGEVEENTPNNDKSRTVLMCKDHNNILAQRSITGTYTAIDLGQLYYNVLSEKCPEVDLTGINTSTGVIVDKIQADAVYISSFFDDLEREYSYKLSIDFDLKAIFIDGSSGASGITLSEGDSGNVIDGTQNLKNSNVSRKNKIVVIGGSETIADFDEDQLTWTTGDSTTILLSNRIDNLTWVKFAGVTKTVDVDFEIIQNGSAIKLLTIANGNTVDTRYDYLNPIWYAEQDPSTSKVRELTVKDSTILTQERAITLAQALLTKLGVPIIKGTVASDDITSEFTLLQTLNLSDVQGFTGVYIISGYREEIKGIYKVTFTLTQVLDDVTIKLFDLIKDVDKLKNTNTDIAIIRDGFTLFDLLGLSETLEGYEQGVGTRWIFDHPTNSKMDDGKTMDTYNTTETQFL
jgi:hypothetical protein